MLTNLDSLANHSLAFSSLLASCWDQGETLSSLSSPRSDGAKRCELDVFILYSTDVTPSSETTVPLATIHNLAHKWSSREADGQEGSCPTTSTTAVKSSM